jgi:hypothetical protein
MLLPEDSRLLKSAKSSVAAHSPLQAKPPSTPRVHSSSPPPKPSVTITKEDDARETRHFQNQIAAAPKPSSPPRVVPANFIGPIAPGVRRAAPFNPALGTRPKPAFGTAGTFPAANRPRSTPLVTKLVTKEEDARETRKFQNQIAAAPKPSSPSRVAPLNFTRPTAPGARRAAPSNPAPTQPKPAFGTAGDLAAATKANQDASKALADFRKDHTLSNRGGLRQESEMALRQADNVANKRYAAAKAAKAAQDAPAAIPTSLNRGGVRQEAINDARREASSARTTYLNSQGLDSSGKPIVVAPPKPPAPAKPENKSFWDNATDFVKDHVEDIGHGALAAAGFIPVVGAAADLANAGWYLAEGDKVNAALSAVAAIPGAGDAVAATAIAGKVALKGAKALEVATKVEKAGAAISTTSRAGKAINKGIVAAGVTAGTVEGVRASSEGDWKRAGSSFAIAAIGARGIRRSAHPQSFSAGGSRNSGFNHSLTSDKPRLAIEARPHRPAIEARPHRLAIEASPQAWKEQRAKSKIESSSSSSHDHGHSRHGAQTSLAEHELRVRTGKTPDGKIDKKPPDRSTRFDTHTLEMEARKRAQEKLQGTPTIAVNARGEAKLKLRQQPIVVDGPASGYGSGVELQTSRAAHQVNSAGEATPLPGPTTRYTGQDPHALARPKYNWADGKWELVTIHPTNKPVT